MDIFNNLKDNLLRRKDSIGLPRIKSISNKSKNEKHKYIPKKQQHSIMTWTMYVITLLFLFFLFKMVTNWDFSGIFKDEIEDPPESLNDREYYDYDFEDIEPEIIEKFDNGAEHYLISEFGTDVLTGLERRRYELELNMLLDSTIEKYDLAEFRGYKDGAKNRDHVLLCVPLRDAEKVLPLMFKHLMNLTYPHDLIDLALLVSDCS